MPHILEITDENAPELDVFAHLTQTQLRNRLEPEKGIFIAESAKVIGYALDVGCKPLALLMDHKHVAKEADKLIARCAEVPVYTAEDALLEKLTGYRLTRGVLCAMQRPKESDVEAVCQNARRVAVLEGIVDSTNIGAVFRSAAALGMDGILLSPTCCDPLCRRAVRVSMGTVFQIPWARMGHTPADWPHNGLNKLHRMGFQTAAMALDDRAVSMDDPVLAAQDRLAVVLGTEGDGLMDETIRECTYTVCIPMSHGVNSLNVAAAAAVAFWQLGRR